MVRDGPAIRRVSVRLMRGTVPTAAAQTGDDTMNDNRRDNLDIAFGDTLPDCPECGERMQKRINRTTGETFLGCSDYPTCLGTKPLDDSGDADDGLPSERTQRRDRRRWDQ